MLLLITVSFSTSSCHWLSEQSSTSVDAILLAPFPLHAWKLAGLNRAVAAIERGKTKMSLVGCNSIHIFTPEALSNGMKTIKAFAAALKKEREREKYLNLSLVVFSLRRYFSIRDVLLLS